MNKLLNVLMCDTDINLLSESCYLKQPQKYRDINT